jgi:hypothetical protein
MGLIGAFRLARGKLAGTIGSARRIDVSP